MNHMLRLPSTRGRRDTVVTALLVATFALLPLLEVRLTKTVAASDVTLVLAALLCFVGGPMGRWPFTVVPRTLVTGITLMGVGGAFALLFADLPLDSAVLLGRLLVAAGISLFVVLWWDPPAQTVRWLLGAFVVGATLSAGLGAASATVLLDVTDSWRDVIDRSTGLTGNANHLGAVSAIGASLALGLAATASSRPRVAVCLGAAAIQGAGLMWSGSRSGLVGVALGALVIAWRLWTERRRGPVLAVVGAAALVLLLAVVGVVRIPTVDRLLLRTDTVASTYSVESTEVRLELAKDRIDDAGPASLVVGGGMENSTFEGGHSGHLEIWVGLGALGFAGWIVVCVATLAPVAAVARRPGRRLGTTDAALLIVGAGFVAHLGTTVFLEHIWDRYIWLLVALVALLRPQPGEAPDAEDPEPAAEAPDA